MEVDMENDPGNDAGCSVDQVKGSISCSLSSIHEEKHDDLKINVFSFCDDPALWEINEETRDYVAVHGASQNEQDFNISKQNFGNKKSQYILNDLFNRCLINGEVIPRPWLVYSKSKECMFCMSCRLFGANPSAFTEGFNDWERAAMCVQSHEKLTEHLSSFTTLQLRGIGRRRVENPLIDQLFEETRYWKDIMKRVCVTVKSLAKCGLLFDGRNQHNSSLDYGTFIGTVALFAEFDPFLSGFLVKYGSVGYENTTYLSKTTYNDLLKCMHDKLQKQIVSELKIAKYFAISIDSMPDISYVDKLTFILRYVKKGKPVERFFCFIDKVGYEAEQIMQSVLRTLKEHDIDIQDCRGLSYDNAFNMSGVYTGLQAQLQEVNKLANYAPSAAHSLNLIGTNAAGISSEAMSFFNFLEGCYTFFSASAHRWEVLSSHLTRNVNAQTLMNLYTTRWSGSHDACLALKDDWQYIKSALKYLEDDLQEKASTQSEANRLVENFNRLETALMAVTWGSILQQFNSVNQKFCNVDNRLGTPDKLYTSLSEFLTTMRANFEQYEELAKKVSGISKYEYKYEYEYEQKRKRKPSSSSDESTENDAVHLDSRDNFRINTFYAVIDQLTEELRRCCEAYKKLHQKFFFLECLTANKFMPSVPICAKDLVADYPDDLEVYLGNECVLLGDQIKNIAGRTESKTISICELSTLMQERKLQDFYPNVYVAIRILLCNPAIKCAWENTFPCLNRVKTYLRNTKGQEPQKSVAFLIIESELCSDMDCDDLISEFAAAKARDQH